MVAYNFKPNIQEAEAGRLCEFKGSQGFTVRPCHKDLNIHKHVYTHIPHTEKNRYQYIHIFNCHSEG